VVISHPQALHQSSDYLKKNFPHARWITVESTAAAFEHVKQEGDTQAAVVGPKEAAKHFGFKTLMSNIENDTNNATSFIAIAKKSPKTRPARKPSVRRSKSKRTLKN